jgi:DNA-directed RNA polymerase subunit RPC12/RpoP
MRAEEVGRAMGQAPSETTTMTEYVCGECHNDRFMVQSDDFGWLRLRCTECEAEADPDDPEDFEVAQ